MEKLKPKLFSVMKSYTKEQFAVIHPGGAVGERLLGKAEDVI